MSCPIVIVNYDFRWPLVYEEEKRRISGVTGNRILDIEHIGSTAVVGLGGRHIVDVMAGVNGSPVAVELLPLLGQIGYEDVIRLFFFAISCEIILKICRSMIN